MKIFILHVVLLISLCSTTLTGHAQTAPDSLAEQKTIRLAGADICRQLEAEDKKKPLSKLSKDEAQQLFTRLTMISAANNPDFMTLLTSNGGEGTRDAIRARGEEIGRQIAMWLLVNCPVGQQLFIRLGAEQLNQPQPVPLRPEEEKALRPIASALCRDLQPRVGTIKALSTDERQQVVTQAFEKHLKAHATQLKKVFGADIFENQDRMRDMGTKVGLQMATECPEAVMLFSDFNKKTQE